MTVLEVKDVTGGYTRKPVLHDLNFSIEKGELVGLIGLNGAGKSTLLNGLLKDSKITTSAHPGTTLGLIEMDYEDFKLYDTPGLKSSGSVLTYCDEKDLKTIIPSKTIKPMVFQLKQNQSLLLSSLF